MRNEPLHNGCQPHADNGNGLKVLRARASRAGRSRRSELERLESRLCLNGELAITGISVTPTVVEGGAVTLDVTITDSRSLTHDIVVTWGDGQVSSRGLPTGERTVQMTHVYADTIVQGAQSTCSIGVTVNAGSLLIGTDVVYIVDRSGSTSDQFAGTPVGDFNGDGDPNTILDAQLDGYRVMNQSLIDGGLGGVSRVSLIAFEGTAIQVDMDPSVAGNQVYTSPAADADNDGVLDVIEALRSITYGGTTNYEAALDAAIASVQAMNSQPGQSTVVFLSDGYPNTGGDYTVPTNTLKTTYGANVRAFGVGTSSSLSDLQRIDPLATQFLSTDELNSVLGGTGGQGGGGSATASVQTLIVNAAPTVEAGIDMSIYVGNPYEVGFLVSDVGMNDTFTCAWTVTDDATGAIVAQGTEAVTRPPTVPTASVAVKAGSLPVGVYTLAMTATDDDGASGFDSSKLTVLPPMVLTGPHVVDAKACAIRGNQFSQVVVTFDAALDRASATRCTNYALMAAGRDGRLGTTDDVVIRVTSAQYYATQGSVVLTLGVRPCLSRNYTLVVVGSAPRGVRGVDGTYLAGTDFAAPGTDYRAPFVPHRAPAWWMARRPNARR